MMGTMRESSRNEWNSGSTIEDINAGSLQRIADACELMANNHAALIAERDRYERWYKEARADNERMARRVSALRGTITRMKRAATRTEGTE